jgi:chromate transporter
MFAADPRCSVALTRRDGTAAVDSPHVKGSALEVLGVSTRLGLTSFGGPVAHLGYFREEYVRRRGWISEDAYADLVALCQFLPGPTSSQVGVAIGILRAGLPGAVASWLGFTLPSAIILVAFAFGLQRLGVTDAGWLHGLKIAAVAVVANAVWGMARSLAPDRERATLAILSAIVVLAWPGALGQVLVIALAALIGWRLLGSSSDEKRVALPPAIGRRTAIVSIVVFLALLGVLPVLRQVVTNQAFVVFDSFFRVGSLVFGGGHVVLPLLQAEVVPPGWVTNEEFVAGYGAAQAVPGPLFTFAAYLGAVMHQRPNGIAGAAIALVAIFLPTFLMVVGALPFLSALRARAGFQAALRGINAAVVGLLLAALYHPVWTSAIKTSADLALALVVFALLAWWSFPAWLVVLIAALGGAVLAY